jgi:hypothetical protein
VVSRWWWCRCSCGCGGVCWGRGGVCRWLGMMAVLAGGGEEWRWSAVAVEGWRPVQGLVGPDLGPAWPVTRPVDRVLGWPGRSAARLTGFLNRDAVSLSCSSRKSTKLTKTEGKRWNWGLKVGEIVDQALQHQIHGPKPLKTQPNHRSVKRQIRAIFGDFWGKFLDTKLDGWGVKSAETKGC